MKGQGQKVLVNLIIEMLKLSWLLNRSRNKLAADKKLKNFKQLFEYFIFCNLQHENNYWFLQHNRIGFFNTKYILSICHCGFGQSRMNLIFGHR